MHSSVVGAPPVFLAAPEAFLARGEKDSLGAVQTLCPYYRHRSVGTGVPDCPSKSGAVSLDYPLF